MKYKLFCILIVCSLILPVSAIQESEMSEPQSNLDVIENLASDESKNEELASQEDLPVQYKEPFNYRKTIKSFLIAMMYVVGSSIFLYGMLSLYNKFRDGIYSDFSLSQENDSPLETPQDISEAVSSFVKKTHWD